MTTAAPQPRRSRRAWGGAMAILPLGVLLGSALVWSQGPARLPVGWSGVRPDTWASGGAVFGVLVSIAGAAAVLAALAAALSGLLSGGASRWLVTALATVGAAAAGCYGLLSWGTAVAGADDVHLWWPLATVPVGVGWGVLTARVHGDDVPALPELLARIPERDRVQPIGGKRREPRSWQGRSASRFLLLVAVFSGVVFLLSGAALVITGDSFLGWLVLLLGVPFTGYVFAWSRIVIDIDAAGLTVHSGTLPVRLLRIPAGSVIATRATELHPMKWGGYGLRPTPGRTAYIVTGADGLVVHRDNGRVWALEVGSGDVHEAALALRLNAGQARAVTRSSSAS